MCQTIATIKTMRGVSVSDVNALCVCVWLCGTITRLYLIYCMRLVGCQCCNPHYQLHGPWSNKQAAQCFLFTQLVYTHIFKTERSVLGVQFVPVWLMAVIGPIKQFTRQFFQSFTWNVSDTNTLSWGLCQK